MTSAAITTNRSAMPRKSPLAMPEQNLKTPFVDPNAPRWKPKQKYIVRRIVVFLPAVLTTAFLLAAFSDWFSTGGLQPLEYFLMALVGLTFIWISLAVSTATLGLLRRWRHVKIPVNLPKPSALNTALLLPVFHENAIDVFSNVAAMLDDLDQTDCPAGHVFSFFILSDTQDEIQAQQEWQAYEMLREMAPACRKIHYRHRTENAGRKVGNLGDWVTQWGGAYDAILILDADSLMTASAIVELSDQLSADPGAGLIQSYPRIIRAQTLFGRAQQFANITYGWLLAEGLAFWSGRECNYWGHNAILRTAAFAACAGLPLMRGLNGKQHLIMSHDFVEAALLRRAGWAVRFLPQIGGSFEETPATLIDFTLRDRRWCQGNLQHLRIMWSAGFHPVSRFHMLHGAVSYLLSPAWLFLLTIWALLGNGQDSNVIAYFSDANPLVPNWPTMTSVNSFLILLFMYAMLLAPKLMGGLAMMARHDTRAAYEGSGQFLLSFGTELLSSVVYAPILMVQQTLAIFRILFGYRDKWSPQKRNNSRYSLATLFKFHIVETTLGGFLAAGTLAGFVSVWLLPITLSLLGATFFSAISGWKIMKSPWGQQQLMTMMDDNPPEIIAKADALKFAIYQDLTTLSAPDHAAE